MQVAIKILLSLSAVALLFCPPAASAGPPFLTDDPEPVDYQHWELYFASLHTQTSDGWSGTAPHIELNYGVITNMQLHVIMPIAYNTPVHGTAYYGYGDTELGVKYRFVDEGKYTPEIGAFPLLEVPTGSEAKGLGSGHLQAFLPLWAQKNIGDWTVYGGGGYGINPGPANRSWGFAGMVLQRQVTKDIALGGEVYHLTAMQPDAEGNTAFNIGTTIDFTEYQHLLFSAGRSIEGPVHFQAYIAYQFTFGPEVFQTVSRWFRRQ